MNILIKLMSIVSLVIAPHIAAPDRGVAPVQGKRPIDMQARPHVRYTDSGAHATEALFVLLRQQL